MGTRNGRRTALACTSATVIAALTACAPAQPPPQPGGAKLSADVVAYDRPEFLTHRAPVLEGGKECQEITPDLLKRLGAPNTEEPMRSSGNKGCEVELADAGVLFASSPAPFKTYWMGSATDYQLPGTSAYGSQPSSFARKLLDEKYHAVEYVTDANTNSAICWTIVDTGAPRSFAIGVYPRSENISQSLTRRIPLAELQKTHCPAASNIAQKTLRILDPQGGSRAS